MQRRRRRRLEVLDREQRLAVERRQELDAGVDRAAAPARTPARRPRRVRRSPPCRRRSRLRCSLPWCRCSARPRAASRARCASWLRVDLDDAAAVEEADRLRSHARLSSGQAVASDTAITVCLTPGANEGSSILTVQPMNISAMAIQGDRAISRLALRADLLDFTADPGLGRHRAGRRALSPRPLAADRRTAASPARCPAAQAPDAGLAAASTIAAGC